MDDNICTFCKQDKPNKIAWVIECVHLIGSDQCEECKTFQICFDCTEDSDKVKLWTLAESADPKFLLKGN